MISKPFALVLIAAAQAVSSPVLAAEPLSADDRELIEEVATVAKQNQDFADEGRYSIAVVYAATSNRDQAEAIARKINDPSVRETVAINISKVYAVAGELDDAFRILKEYAQDTSFNLTQVIRLARNSIGAERCLAATADRRLIDEHRAWIFLELAGAEGPVAGSELLARGKSMLDTDNSANRRIVSEAMCLVGDVDRARKMHDSSESVSWRDVLISSARKAKDLRRVGQSIALMDLVSDKGAYADLLEELGRTILIKHRLPPAQLNFLTSSVASRGEGNRLREINCRHFIAMEYFDEAVNFAAEIAKDADRQFNCLRECVIAIAAARAAGRSIESPENLVELLIKCRHLEQDSSGNSVSERHLRKLECDTLLLLLDPSRAGNSTSASIVEHLSLILDDRNLNGVAYERMWIRSIFSDILDCKLAPEEKAQIETLCRKLIERASIDCRKGFEESALMISLIRDTLLVMSKSEPSVAIDMYAELEPQIQEEVRSALVKELAMSISAAQIRALCSERLPPVPRARVFFEFVAETRISQSMRDVLYFAQ